MQVDAERRRGNYQGARSASYKALGWGIAGIVTGFILTVTLLAIFFVVIYPTYVKVDSTNDQQWLGVCHLEL